MGEGCGPNALGKEKNVHPAGQAIQLVDLQNLPGYITKEALRLYFFFLFFFTKKECPVGFPIGMDFSWTWWRIRPR